MADEEDLKLLREGSLDLSNSDLRRADISNLNLQNRNFFKSHFDEANARNSDFRGCNLRKAHFQSLVAEGANLEGVMIDTMLVGVKLVSANLRNAALSNIHIVSVDFSRADIRGAKFRGAHFGKDVLFNDVIFDDATDFEGADGLRYLSRLPAFRNFVFEKGIFRRRPNDLSSDSASPEIFDLDEIGENTRFPEGQSGRARTLEIQKKIADHPTETFLLAANLSLSIEQHIEVAEARKPNQPEALATHESNIHFLKTIADGLREISVILEREEIRSETISASSEKAAGIVARLSDYLECWLLEHERDLVNQTLSVGLIGLTSAFFVWCGGPGYMAFATAAAIIGGKPLIQTIREFQKSFPKRK